MLQFLIGDDAEGISSKSDCEEILCGRVKGLRDVVELHFEVDTERTEHPSDKINAHRHQRREGWICPITAKPLGAGVKAVYLVPCGHVFTEEAIRQLKGDKCLQVSGPEISKKDIDSSILTIFTLQCDEAYTEDNVISILPTKEEEKQRLIARGQKLAEQGLTHSLKKAPGSKKRKKHATDNSVDAPSNNADAPKSAAAANDRSNTSTPTPGGNIKNASAAKIAARVKDEQDEKNKRQKRAGLNENLDSLFTKKDSKKSGDFMTRGFTIPASARR